MNGNLAESHKNGDYTYEDYLSWDGEERYELIDGWAYLMAAPTPAHQRLVTRLALKWELFLEGKQCTLYPDIDVRLHPVQKPKRGLSLYRKDTCVRPDLSIVCDPEQVDEHGCNGAPTLVIEVLSPSTAKYDRTDKYKEYLDAGVQEYWMVDPQDQYVQVCVLKDGHYILQPYDHTETITTVLFPGLEINLSEIFPEAPAEPPGVQPEL